MLVVLLVSGGWVAKQRWDTYRQAWRPDEISIDGKVADARDGSPIAGAFVVVQLEGSHARALFSPHGQAGCLDGSAALTTDRNGHYHFAAKREDVEGKYPITEWGASLRLYKPGWRLDPPTTRFEFYPNQQTDFAMAPATVPFKARVDAVSQFTEHLCELGDVDRGWSALHVAVFDDLRSEYCDGDTKNDLSYRTFLDAFGWVTRQADLVRDRKSGPERLDVSGTVDRAIAAEKALETKVPTYPWPTGLMANAGPTTRDFSAQEKEVICAHLLEQRLPVEGHHDG